MPQLDRNVLIVAQESPLESRGKVTLSIPIVARDRHQRSFLRRTHQANLRRASAIDGYGDLFVDLIHDTPLRHYKSDQQHRTLTVPAGAWKVIRKTEFDVRSSVAPRRVVID